MAVKKIEILLQGENIPDIQLVTFERGKKAADLLAEAARLRKDKGEDGYCVFAEDSEEPLTEHDELPHDSDGKPGRFHVHRCRRITVTVTFNGANKERVFGPGVPVATVKKWAAIRAFGMDPGDAAEHVLQLTGTSDRPEPDTHIGALVSCPTCSLAFDLVPLKRVEG